jgi:hypothetical protein
MTTFDATLDRLFNTIIQIESEALPTDRIAANVRMNRLRGIRVRIDRMLFGAPVERAEVVTYSGEQPKPKAEPKPKPKPAMRRTPAPTKLNNPELNDPVSLLDYVADTTLPEYDDINDTWFVIVTYTGSFGKVRYQYSNLGKAMAAVLQTTEQKKGSAA